jgi:hypothetical protein
MQIYRHLTRILGALAALWIVAILAAAVFFSRQAGAAELADDALAVLIAGKTWTASKTLANDNVSVWKWNADGTVCLWLGSQDGKCTDEGTWKIVDKLICYKFTWWLKSNGLVSACFSVADLGNGNYEAKLPIGTRFLAFRVSP